MSGCCTQMRRKLVRHSTLNIESGDTKEIRSEWVTEPCNVPLFGDVGNVCRSCLGGWTHPENYAVKDSNIAP